MVKPIVKDMIFLSQKSENATKSDIAVAVDLDVVKVLCYNATI